ncbi:MAG TPA: helix-turn-helix transcriptional regulator [Mycobacteriales bacterium]|nr:helix-turn-helix transcriptional regulator [Mycobacteriales bacterium]
MRVERLLHCARTEAGLSVRGLAEAAGVAASTVHRIEKGELNPTVETLARLLEAAGTRLRIDPYVDYAASIVGLARSIREDIAGGDYVWPIRKTAELAHRFGNADPDVRHRMVTAEPPTTGDRRWDVFLGGLAEWLTVRAAVPVPAWARAEDRYLDHGWWITPMESMHAWEYAGTPASFQIRGVYIHRDSLTNV